LARGFGHHDSTLPFGTTVTPEVSMILHQFRATGFAVLLALFPGVQAQAQDSAPDALRETFRDWTVQCEMRPETGRVCEMLQQVSHDETGRNVLLFSLRYNTDGDLVGVLVLPFGLRLAEGVQIAVGETVFGPFGFDTCLNNGCVVLAVLEPQDITAMRAGVEGQIQAVTRNGEAFGIPVSFMGFTAAFNRLNALQDG